MSAKNSTYCERFSVTHRREANEHNNAVAFVNNGVTSWAIISDPRTIAPNITPSGSSISLMARPANEMFRVSPPPHLSEVFT